ncbi:uncharacterized protein LOC120640442 isoform X11 [Panicum virgatum]|uniref:uncharacterized protein LOC120640442 isoform X11 n=1 Tax=Panicum virgatum TaxID=38727 RepID=UPI0019D687E7|nr:uncharacterized protein LOC120640442 isoform X11 [Panicum virgatum]
MGRVSFTASAPVLFAPLLSSGSNLLCSRPSALQACSVSPGVACFPFLLLSSGGLPLRHILGDCLLLQFVRKKCGHAVMIYADGLMVVHRNLANRTQICTTIYIVQMRHFSFRASEPTYGWPPAAEATGKNNRSQGDLARRIQERA